MDRRIDRQLGRHTYRRIDIKVSTAQVNIYIVTDCAAMATKHLNNSLGQHADLLQNQL